MIYALLAMNVAYMIIQLVYDVKMFQKAELLEIRILSLEQKKEKRVKKDEPKDVVLQ